MEASSKERWIREARSVRVRRGAESRPSARVVLVPFSTRVPPDVLDRLRIAAPQLSLRQGDIVAVALDAFLLEHGF